MITIAIHGAEFFAYHGFYPEEQKSGGNFIVDVELSFANPGNLNDDNIMNTVDYEKVYNVVADQMKHTRKLIETVAQSIAEEVKEMYAFADNIKVSVKKLRPPLNGRVDYTEAIITDTIF